MSPPVCSGGGRPCVKAALMALPSFYFMGKQLQKFDFKSMRKWHPRDGGDWSQKGSSWLVPCLEELFSTKK